MRPDAAAQLARRRRGRCRGGGRTARRRCRSSDSTSTSSDIASTQHRALRRARAGAARGAGRGSARGAARRRAAARRGRRRRRTARARARLARARLAFALGAASAVGGAASLAQRADGAAPSSRERARLASRRLRASQQAPLGERDHRAAGRRRGGRARARRPARSALFSVCVRNSSARDGSATPDGWLCARITAAALQLERALDDLARVDAGLGQRAAEHLLERSSRFWASRNITAKTSCAAAAELQLQVVLDLAPANRTPAARRSCCASARRAISSTARDLGALGRPQALDRASARRAPACSRPAQAAEALEQLLRELQHRDARQPGAQQQRQQFGIGQRAGAAGPAASRAGARRRECP